MGGESLDDDCAVRARRAYAFARAAADANFGVDFRNVEVVLLIAERDGLDCLNGAMFGAGGAIGHIEFYDAQVFVEDCRADFYGMFLFACDELNRARRARLRAAVAIEEAEALGVIHIWLEDVRKSPLAR